MRAIVLIDPGISAECQTWFAADDPMFAGHFPGNPLVPGVILTEALAQTAGIAAASAFDNEQRPLFLLSAIRAMKFTRGVRPVENISLHAFKRVEIGELLQFEVVAKVSDNVAAEGQIVLSRFRDAS